MLIAINSLSRRTKTSVTVHQPHIPISSQSTSYSEDDYIDDSYDYTEPDEDWEDEDDLQPSDSASASNGHVPIHHRAARRSHRVVPQYRQHLQSHQGHQAQAPPSVDHPNEAEWAGHYGRAQSAYYQQAQTSHAPYIAGQAARGHHGYHQQQGNHVGAYMGAYPNGNQMVPYANYGANNPFSPMGNGSNGNNFYNGEGRGMYDMMPYQHNGFYGNPQHYGVPAHMQQFQMVPAPPVPAPTEHPAQSTTPAPKEPPAPPPPDPEKIRLEAEVAAFKKVQEEAKAAEKQREIEAQIRKDAEDNFQRRMEDMRKAQEEAQKEIERARIEAERAARERIEAERKAEDERQKAHNEAMQRAEQNARMRFEAELKAAEERRKQEEEDRKRAEEAARIRLEAAIKAEAEAKAAADKKAAEEVARLKQIEEDAKRKAEADAAAKVEKEKADAAAKAEADAAAKKEAEELKKKYQEEAKAKFEEAAKKKSDKAPIKFKDAVGRKFSFPFHLCATWQVSSPTYLHKRLSRAYLLRALTLTYLPPGAIGNGGAY